MRAFSPAAVTRKLIVSPSPTGSTVSVPPRGIVCCAMTSMFSSSLTRFFGSSSRGKFQAMRDLAVLDMAARHVLRVAEIDLRARRSGRAERQAAELQPRRGGLGALANQIEREFAVFGLRIVVEHLKPIDDRADRADEIVADPRTQQRRQLEGIGSGTGRRSARHRLFLESRAQALADSCESRMLRWLDTLRQPRAASTRRTEWEHRRPGRRTANEPLMNRLHETRLHESAYD